LEKSVDGFAMGWTTSEDPKSKRQAVEAFDLARQNTQREGLEREFNIYVPLNFDRSTGCDSTHL